MDSNATGNASDHAAKATDNHEQADVAILFVHGMGETRPGDSIVRFLDPMLEWLQRWSTNDGEEGSREVTVRNLGSQQAAVGKPQIEPPSHTVLHGAVSTEVDHTPPHAFVGLTRDNGISESRKILFTEAWWAREFTPPKFGDVASWGLGLGPFLISRHFALDEQEATRGNSFGRKYLRYAFGLILVLLFNLAMCSLTLIGIIPFARNYVSGIMSKLIGSFGDVMVYELGMVRPPAILNSVERSYAWMKEHLKQDGRIIVVGYSLGSLIAYDLLKRPTVTAHSVVTLGSPLKKSHIMRQIQRDPLNLANGAANAMIGMGLVVLAVLLALVGQGFTGPSAIWSAFANTAWPEWHVEVGAWQWLYGGFVTCAVLCLSRLALWTGRPSRISPTEYVAPGSALAATAMAVYLAATAWSWELAGAAVSWAIAFGLLCWREFTRSRLDAAWLQFSSTIDPPILAAIQSSNTHKDAVYQLKLAQTRLRANTLHAVSQVRESLLQIRTPTSGISVIADNLDAVQTGSAANTLNTKLGAIRNSRDVQTAGLDSPIITHKATRDRVIIAALLAGVFLTLSRFDASLSTVRFSLIVPVLIAAIALLWSTIKVPLRLSLPSTRLQLEVPESTGDAIPWLDFWGGADPVSEFGLEINTIHSPNIQMKSVMTHNRRHLPGDHSVYQDNDEEFNSELIAGLLRNMGWFYPEIGANNPETTPAPPVGSDLARARSLRRWRVDSYLVAFWFYVGMALLIPLMVGTNGLSQLWNELSIFNVVVDWIVEKLDGPEKFTTSAGNESTAIFGFAVVACVIWLWFTQVVEQAWQYWDRVEGTRYFQQSRVIPTSLQRGKARGPQVFFGIAFLAPVLILGITLATTDHLRLGMPSSLAPAATWSALLFLASCITAIVRSHQDITQ